MRKKFSICVSEEMRVLSGVVYMSKVKDREQSLEEHHNTKYARKRSLHLTRKEWDAK